MRNIYVFGIILLLLTITLPVFEHAEATPPVREPFNSIQIYYPEAFFYWGPAIYYEQVVTIVYEGTNKHNFKEGHFNLVIVGSATIYAGIGTSGEVLDKKPFINIETWYEPDNTWGWPVSYYSKDVKYLKYKWEIAGIYSFDIICRDGYWTIWSTAFTSPPTTGGYFPNTPPIEFPGT